MNVQEIEFSIDESKVFLAECKKQRLERPSIESLEARAKDRIAYVANLEKEVEQLRKENATLRKKLKAKK